MTQVVQKYHRYFVYTPDTSHLIAEWTDVTNDFEYTDEVNTLGGDVTILLGRSIRSKVVELGYLQDDTGANVLDENDLPITTENTATINVGEGTDVDHENRVAVYEYYGTLDTLLDETGDAILDEAGQAILTETGALNGRRVFFGKVSKWAVDESSSGSSIVVTAVPLSTAYNDLIFENYLWQATQNLPSPVLAQPLSAQDGVNNSAMAQTFQAPASGPYLRAVIGLYFSPASYVYGNVPIAVKLYSGNTPNGARTLLHTYTLTVDLSVFAGESSAWNLSILEGPSLTLGSWYHLEVTTATPRITGEVAPAYVLYNNGNTYATGSFWMKVGGATTFTEYTVSDVYFAVDVLTARETKVTYNTQDLYQFVDQTIDVVRQRMPDTVNPNNSVDGDAYVENAGVTVPEIVLNLDTMKTRMDIAVQAAPPGWYYRYDHAGCQMVFKGRRDVAEHILITGVHLKSIEVEWDADGIVNTVYFTGGLTDPNDVESSLFIRRTDPDSVDKYGVRSKAISDQRITNLSSAELRVQYELLKSKEPVYRTTVAVADSVYDVSTIQVGQTVGFSGNGTFVDDLILQVMRKATYKGYVILTLGSLPSTERKRLADIKAAFDTLVAANNAVSPS